MHRPTIADLARAANVSVSTVDRVLSGRDPVREATARQVLAAAERIGFYAVAAIRQRLGADRPELTLGFLLQQGSRPFYRALGEALTAATLAAPGVRGLPRIEFLDDLTPDSVAAGLLRLGRECDAIGVVAADHPRVTAAIDELSAEGVPVFALISDLTAQSRAGYIGLDNWKVGRTAAWGIAHICHRPGKVGILVGSHRYLCQDVCEMGFRSYFREHAPGFELLEPLTSLEESRLAYESTVNLLRRHPDLVGLFVAGGGISGVVPALRERGEGAAGQIVTVGLDLMDVTRSALIDGVLKLVISHPLSRLAAAAVDAMARPSDRSRLDVPIVTQLPFDVFTPENI